MAEKGLICGRKGREEKESSEGKGEKKGERENKEKKKSVSVGSDFSKLEFIPFSNFRKKIFVFACYKS